MDYTIEIAIWNLGFDEADELVDAIAELLVERGLGAEREQGDEGDIRSIVVLRPQGMERLDVSKQPNLRRFLTRFTRGARRITLPGADYTRSIP